jgi:hypothetical protein
MFAVQYYLDVLYKAEWLPTQQILILVLHKAPLGKISRAGFSKNGDMSRER